jgi:hypothetical protein|tara:strand:+ start:255 stop:623 length:369 start_codon:yes stop_codon:yes gene_type:complete
MAKAVCERVLNRAMALDMNASISSISRCGGDDATLVKIRTSDDAGLGVLAALRAAWPLATVSLVQNRIDGNTEAQVLLPSERDQRDIAKTIANFAAWQQPLRLLANALIAALAISCALSIAL